MRKEGDCLEKEIMQSTVPAERKQKRPRMQWTDNMKKCTEMSFEELLRETEEMEMELTCP